MSDKDLEMLILTVPNLLLTKSNLIVALFKIKDVLLE